MKALALSAIRFYQRYMSPRKRFCCAYAAYTSDASCSALGYRAIRRFGLWNGIKVLNQRLARCGAASTMLARAAQQRVPRQRRQAGFLDCGGCDGAGGGDLPNCSGGKGSGFHPGDCLNCGGCDWPSTNKGTDRKRYRRDNAENEEAVKRRSRLLRERHNKPDQNA